MAAAVYHAAHQSAKEKHEKHKEHRRQSVLSHHSSRPGHDGEHHVSVEVVELRVDRLPHQTKVRTLYQATPCQMIVAALIFVNFIVSATRAQLQPEDETVFKVFEWFFGVVFTIELIVNIYGHWFAEFWHSAWNWFDFIIVGISLLALMFEDMPGISVLRLFRAFRVFRLFKRIKSLKQIIEGVVVSLPGVGNAFIVLGLIMSIWSIMGVEFFGALMPDHFGNFAYGVITMWQVMTMDSWASGIMRPLIFELNGGLMVAVFFISYVFIAGIVLANVVVAVLLEKFIGATAEDEEEETEEEILRNYGRSDSMPAARKASIKHIPRQPTTDPVEFEVLNERLATVEEAIPNMEAKLDALLTAVKAIQLQLGTALPEPPSVIDLTDPIK